jgi:hypothetical protein
MNGIVLTLTIALLLGVLCALGGAWVFAGWAAGYLSAGVVVALRGEAS